MMQNYNKKLQFQTGTALVTALLIVALASVIATAMLKQQHIDIRRANNMVKGDQAVLYLRVGENWVRKLLAEDSISSKIDSLTEDWAKENNKLDVDGGTIQFDVEDLQGRLNLNNLLDQEGRPSKPDLGQFRNLLVALELDPELTQPIVDWIDTDINVSLPTGAEDQEYLALDQPYRTANAPFVSSSELMLIKGFSREIFDKLAPYITALPKRVEVNVNTASIPVFAAVIGVDLVEAESIYSARPEKGYQDITEFRGQQALTGKTVVGVNVKSEFFMARVIVGLGRYNVSQHSVIARDNKEASPPVIIQRSRAKI